jgi:hypothetical protein
MWLENARQNTRGYTRAVIYRLDHHPAVFVANNHVDASRASETRILENVEEDISHFVLLRHRPDRTVGATHLPLNYPITHLLEGNNVLYHGGYIDRKRWRHVRRSAPISAEGARDFIQPVDLRQNSPDVLVENRVEIDSGIFTRPPQMLDAQSDRRERILDLMRDLSRHFTPRENALRAGHLDSA